LRIIWRLKGEDYHSLKGAFKASRELLGFRFTSKWNAPVAEWKHDNGTKVEGQFVRMEVDGKEKTLSGTLTLTGDDFDFVIKCKDVWDKIWPVKGEEPQIAVPKTRESVPSAIDWHIHCFDLFSTDAIHQWAMPNQCLWMMPDSTIIVFQNFERKVQKEKWYQFLIDLKERFPDTDLTKLKEPEYLKERDSVTIFGASKDNKTVSELPWDRNKWEFVPPSRGEPAAADT
jgi:hypothetical protein